MGTRNDLPKFIAAMPERFDSRRLVTVTAHHPGTPGAFEYVTAILEETRTMGRGGIEEWNERRYSTSHIIHHDSPDDGGSFDPWMGHYDLTLEEAVRDAKERG